MSTIFVVTGISGAFDEKSVWNICAYTDYSYANKARQFLQKLADKLDKYRNVEYSEEFKRDLEELKLHDPKAWYSDTGRIYYSVEEVKIVV